MSFYEERILPHLLHCSCGMPAIAEQRRKVVPEASGRILEIGMGSGLNLPFYRPEKVDRLWGLEPSRAMRRKAAPRLAQSPVPVHWLDLPGEEIPLDDRSVDCVVMTFTLCTIPDWQQALNQMNRVLRPGGQLLFLEHGSAPDANVQRWQNRLNPLWKKIAGGCHLNRPIPELLRMGNFRVQRMEAGYLPGTPRFAGFNYLGAARRS